MRNCFNVFCIFGFLGILLYFNSLNNKFLIDDYVFLNNPVQSSSKFILAQWNPYREQSLGVLDRHESTGYYRPMAHMVLDFCYDTFKYNYWQYHLLSLFLFVLAASLIYSLIGKIFNNYDLAFLTGLFYLIHPVNGIIVNYISAVVFAFQIVFMLGAVLLLWNSLERKNNRPLYALSLLFCFLSFFWNESGIMTPFYLSAVVLLFGKDPLRKKIILLVPFYLIIISYLLFRSLFLNVDKQMFSQVMSFHSSALLYLSALFQIVMWYITRLFYPQGIVMIWSVPIFNQEVFWNMCGFCALLAIYIFLFARFSKDKIIQLGLIWMLIGFAPVCMGAFRNPPLGALIEPHWFIFSSIGFFLIAAHYCLKILNRTKAGGAILLFCLIFVWGSVSYANNKLWFDEKTYSLYWSKSAPSLKFVNNYICSAYLEDGNLKEAAKYLKLTLSDNPSVTGMYDTLGSIDMIENNWKDAELNYKKALNNDPNSASAYNNLGTIYLKEGQPLNAKEYFIQALRINPLLMTSRISLARIYLNNHEYRQAIDQCIKNLDIKRNDGATLLLLIEIYVSDKDFVNMKKQAYWIINHEADPGVLTNLGINMGQHNFFEIAIDSYTKAIRLAPDYKDAYLNAGTLFAKLGNYDEAIHLWKIGLRIDPSDQRFQKSINEAIKLKKLPRPEKQGSP